MNTRALFILFCFAGMGLAGERTLVSGAATLDIRTVTVVGTAQTAVIPDLVKLTLSQTSQNSDASQAWALNNTNSVNLLKTLEDAGIAAEDVQTTKLSLYRNRDYLGNSQYSDWYYQVTHSLSVTVRQMDGLGNLLNNITAMDSEISINLSLDVSNKSDAYAQSLTSAVNDARAKAEIIAQAEGLTLGEAISISAAHSNVSVDTTTQTEDAYRSIAPGQDQIGTSVRVVYAIQ